MEQTQKEIFPIAVMISSLLQTTLSTHVSGVERVAIKFTMQHKKQWKKATNTNQIENGRLNPTASSIVALFRRPPIQCSANEVLICLSNLGTAINNNSNCDEHGRRIKHILPITSMEKNHHNSWPNPETHLGKHLHLFYFSGLIIRSPNHKPICSINLFRDDIESVECLMMTLRFF